MLVKTPTPKLARILALCAPLLLGGCETMSDFWNTPVSSSSSNERSKETSRERTLRWKDSQAGQQYTRDMYSVGTIR